MKISSDNITRACRKNGRLVYFLKLSLPSAEAENERELCESFNSFYKSAAHEYEALVRAAADAASTRAPVNIISVRYEKLSFDESSSVMAIKRILSYKRDGSVSETESLDFYDFERGIFIKTPKNVKKQRKTP